MKPNAMFTGRIDKKENGKESEVVIGRHDFRARGVVGVVQEARRYHSAMG